MRTRHVVLSVLLSALPSLLCWAGLITTYTEDFEGTLQDSYFRTGLGDVIVPDGGNLGAYLRNPAYASAVPVIEDSAFNVFTAAWTQQGVAGLGIDVNVFALSGAADDRPVSLGLLGGVRVDGEWTACELVLTGKEMPQPGSGWKSYDFNVPVYRRHMPVKWTVHGPCAGLPRDDVWSAVVARIAAVRFYVGDPYVSYDPQVWDIGFDNARITLGKFVDHTNAGSRVLGEPSVPVTVLPDSGE